MLLEEFLRPMAITQVAAARRLRISTNRVNELVRGRRGMTADTALRLSRWLKTTPQFWMHLQVAWDLWHAARKSSAA
jgi:addiction module HigA family antidote